MSGVFISYRRSDSRGTAGRVYDTLADRFGSDRVFRDLDALEPGAVYEGAIERFISSCDVVVAVIGNQWLEVRDETGRRRIDDPADLVRRELEAALDQGKLVIPLLVEDATMPPPGALPGGLAALAGRNALMISDTRWDYDLGRLAEVLQRKLEPGATRPAGAAPPPAARAGREPSDTRSDPSGAGGRRRTIGLVLGAVVAAAVLVLAVAGGGGDDDGSAERSTDESGETELASEAPAQEIGLSPDAGPPGTEVRVAGTGFEAGDTVSVTLDGQAVDEVTADDAGDFEATFAVPDEFAAGGHEVVAESDSGGWASYTFEVT